MYSVILTASEVAAETTQASWISMIVIYGALMFALWFFFMRPQSKERKKNQEMLASLENGDFVCTTSGFYGTIIDIKDDMVIVEFGNNRNCRIPMDKAAISKIEKPGQATETEFKK